MSTSAKWDGTNISACFDKELFEPTAILDTLVCPIGHGILCDPVGLNCNSGTHIFCRRCIDEWFANKLTCPLCNQSFNYSFKVIKIPIIQCMLDSLTMKCCNYGCDWIGKYEQLNSHKLVCEHQITKCSSIGCDVIDMRINIKKHLEICDDVLIDCNFCEMQTKRRDMKGHLDVRCPNYIIKCDKCSIEMPRKDLPIHFINDCEFRLVRCVNKACKQQIPKNELDEHVKICKYKTANCSLCNEEIIIANSNGHADVCPKTEICCKKCTTKFLRQDSDTHFNTCPDETVSCKFAHIGCHQSIKRKDLKQHILDNLDEHLELLDKYGENIGIINIELKENDQVFRFKDHKFKFNLINKELYVFYTFNTIDGLFECEIYNYETKKFEMPVTIDRIQTLIRLYDYALVQTRKFPKKEPKIQLRIRQIN